MLAHLRNTGFVGGIEHIYLQSTRRSSRRNHFVIKHATEECLHQRWPLQFPIELELSLRVSLDARQCLHAALPRLDERHNGPGGGLASGAIDNGAVYRRKY